MLMTAEKQKTHCYLNGKRPLLFRRFGVKVF